MNASLSCKAVTVLRKRNALNYASCGEQGQLSCRKAHGSLLGAQSLLWIAQ